MRRAMLLEIPPLMGQLHTTMMVRLSNEAWLYSIPFTNPLAHARAFEVCTLLNKWWKACQECEPQQQNMLYAFDPVILWCSVGPHDWNVKWDNNTHDERSVYQSAACFCKLEDLSLQINNAIWYQLRLQVYILVSTWYQRLCMTSWMTMTVLIRSATMSCCPKTSTRAALTSSMTMLRQWPALAPMVRPYPALDLFEDTVLRPHSNLRIAGQTSAMCPFFTQICLINRMTSLHVQTTTATTCKDWQASTEEMFPFPMHLTTGKSRVLWHQWWSCMSKSYHALHLCMPPEFSVYPGFLK